ncbi:hypothetical protein HOY80DRAFT_641763 [Tuber brumale]|nr:hypothetical protein HOY80DRAFT_641763 [Tuber brumale]
MWTAFDGGIPTKYIILGLGIGPNSAAFLVCASECTVTCSPTIRGGSVMMWQVWTALGDEIPTISYLVSASDRRVLHSRCAHRNTLCHAPPTIHGGSVMMWQVWTAFGAGLGVVMSVALSHLDRNALIWGRWWAWRYSILVTFAQFTHSCMIVYKLSYHDRQPHVFF